MAESAVDSSMRRVAKTVNFGVIYGLSPFGLAARLGITQAEAAAFIDAYFQEYAGVDAFITRTLEAALADRPRRDDPRPPPADQRHQDRRPARIRNLAERTAVNTVIQGSAADLIKRAMLAVDRRIRDAGLRARMLLQIHDELVFEAPDDEIPALAAPGARGDDHRARPGRPAEGRPRRRPATGSTSRPSHDARGAGASTPSEK